MSSRYGYWNPYRSRKGYIVRKKYNVPAYRQLSIKEIRDLNEKYHISEAIADPSFPSNFYDSFTYPLTVFSDTSLNQYKTDKFSDMLLLNQPTFSVTFADSTAIEISYRYVFLCIVSSEFVSFYSIICSNDRDYRSTFVFTPIGLRPGDKLYLAGLSSINEKSASNPDYLPDFSPPFTLNNKGTPILAESCRSVFHVFKADQTVNAFDLAFTGDSPKYPFLLLPRRLISFE